MFVYLYFIWLIFNATTLNKMITTIYDDEMYIINSYNFRIYRIYRISNYVFFVWLVCVCKFDEEGKCVLVYS